MFIRLCFCAELALQFDREKATCTPNDFTNNPNLNAVKGDNDDAEEDEPEPVVVKSIAGVKKNGNTKPKSDSGANAKQPTNKAQFSHPT